jgi:hypothetical protein
MDLVRRATTAWRSLLHIPGHAPHVLPPQSDCPAADAIAPPAQLMNEIVPVEAIAQAADSATDADIGESTRRTLLAWAMEELAPFRLHGLGYAQAKARFGALNAASGGIYVYEVAGGTVDLLEKPAGARTNSTGERRSRAYLDFFRDVCSRLPEVPPFFLALETGDKVTERVDVPVFAFQKRRGEASILLPDIDFLNHGFYAAPRYQDTRDYRSKRQSAIFVGSTSGGRVTPDAARNCTLPRLRAAHFFEANPRVEFLLPQIVQTTAEEAAEILRQRTFCQAGYMPFPEQLRHRFVISMDGNGATCSRVAITLKSNSVLLKYDSDDLLYYFRHMQPWLHFVPVHKDADIDAILDMEREQPAQFEDIAAAGRQFAETYLSRPAVHAYTAALFEIYAHCFLDALPPLPPPQRPAAAAPVPSSLILMAHVQGRGDVPADGEGWIGDAKGPRSIEGFSVSFGNAALNRQISYRSLAQDGTPQPAAPGGAYCGTRGRAAPLHGFLIEPAAGDAEVPRLDYEGIFLDGFASGKLAPGAPCRSPRGAPLVAMRVGMATG